MDPWPRQLSRIEEQRQTLKLFVIRMQTDYEGQMQSRRDAEQNRCHQDLNLSALRQ